MIKYKCKHCGYIGPCYGRPHAKGVSAPWCPDCGLNNQLVLYVPPENEVALTLMEYTKDIVSYVDVYSVTEFRKWCDAGSFIDHDGHGYPARDGKMNRLRIFPSRCHDIPANATHIVWFNK